MNISKAVRIVAIIGMMFVSGLWEKGAMAAPAASHGNTRFSIDFLKLKCIEETDWDQGTSSDEPYVLFAVGDLTTRNVLVFRTTVFQHVDTGDTRTDLGRPRLWGLNGNTAAIPNASNLIILAAVMENDASEAREIVTGLQGPLLANLNAYIMAGQNRATIVSNLRRDMDNLIDMFAVVSGVTNPDDRLGSTKELPISHTDLINAASGRVVDLSLRFRDGGEDATYRVYFRLRRQ